MLLEHKMHKPGSSGNHYSSQSDELDSEATESCSEVDSGVEEEIKRLPVEKEHYNDYERAEYCHSLEIAELIRSRNRLETCISELQYEMKYRAKVRKQIQTSKDLMVLGGVCKRRTATATSHQKTKTNHWRNETTKQLKIPVDLPRCTIIATCPKMQLIKMSGSANQNHKHSTSRSTCVAARTRPLVRCQQPHLINPNFSPNFNSKANCSMSAQYSCRMNSSGVMSSPNHKAQLQRSTQKPLSRLDLGKHNIPSLKDDQVSIIKRFQQKLQRSEPIKKLTIGHKWSRSTVTTTNMEAKSRWITEQPSTYGQQSDLRPKTLHGQKYKRIARKSLSSYQSTDNLLKTLQDPCKSPQKPVKQQSSSDINGIIFPESMATFRLEKLQYKEVLLPTWRLLDISSQEMTEQESERELEDLSDAVYSRLHQPYKCQERIRRASTAVSSKRSRFSQLVDECVSSNLPTQMLASSGESSCSSLMNLKNQGRTIGSWERRSFPLSQDPIPEPKIESNHGIRRESVTFLYIKAQ